jgi:hypothetical protein
MHRGPGGQKHKADPRPGARPRDTYDFQPRSTHTWIKGMDPDDVVNRLVQNHGVPRGIAEGYTYSA